MLAAFLLLFQINIIAPLPVVNNGELKEDFLYGDNNATIKENELYRNASALHPYASTFDRNASSSEQRNSNIVNLFFKHIRVARESNPCVVPGTRGVYVCGKELIKTVSCKTESQGCNHVHPAGLCKKRLSYCGRQSKVTGCECDVW